VADIQQMRESRGAAAVCAMALLGAVLALVPKSAIAAPAPASVTTVVGGVARGHTSTIGHETAGIVVRGTSLYISDTVHNVVRHVDLLTGDERVVVGNGAPGFSGDGGPASSAQLKEPVGIVMDPAGNLFIADHGNNRIRRVDALTGRISTYAGRGSGSGIGDGGPATAAIVSPRGMAVDGAGNLYIADDVGIGGSIRRVAADGTITTVAGGGSGEVVDGVPATSVRLREPPDVALDGTGNVYIPDEYANAVRRVDPLGLIHTVTRTVGSQVEPLYVNLPNAVQVDGAGNLFVAQAAYDKLYRLTPSGEWALFAGNGTRGEGGDGGPAFDAELGGPADMVFDGLGNMYVAASGFNQVRKIDTGGIITTLAGSGEQSFTGEGVPATNAELLHPTDVAFDGAGNLYVADSGNARLRKVDRAGVITTFLREPQFGYGRVGVAVDPAGNVWLANPYSHVISRYDTSGQGTVVAHGATGVFYGDGGPAIEAGINGPSDLAFDGAGNAYFTEQGGHRVRRIDTNGIISTVLSADDGLNTPSALDVDPAGNIYVIGPYSNGVLKRAPSGRVTTLGAAAISHPTGIAVDTVGTVYVSQIPGPIVRIERNGAVTNVFGSNDGFSGDGGPALGARHLGPQGIETDAAGNLFLADTNNNRVRMANMPVPPATKARTWGWNGYGQLGNGTHNDSRVPTVPLAGVFGVVEVAAGAYHSLAVKDDGSVWAWGWNAYGQLGNGTTADAAAPVRVPGLTGVVSVSAGLLHSLAVKGDGTVWAWGWNYFGQLGNGTNADNLRPVQVRGITNVVNVAAGAFHSLARDNNSLVFAWGFNDLGQLGTGTTTSANTPRLIPDLGARAIAAGAFHSVALHLDGTVRAWGWNGVGQLGDGTTVDRHRPIAVTGLGDVGAISAGYHHNLAVRRDGSVRAWGWNAIGQLGDGTTVDRHVPVGIGLNGVRGVSGGAYHSAAVLADGTARAWGFNYFGELGDGTTTDRLRPVTVSSVTTARAISVGVLHTLAL
jgi:alpha-tubulin suppressor-like RCC1 family protein